jgi:hypothetical protein
VATRFKERQAVFSPDGRWVAYVSNESGRSEVYVQPFQAPGEKRRVSSDGGTRPRWPRDAELFYLGADNRLMVVPVTSGANLELGTPVSLFRPEPAVRFFNSAVHSDYDVTSDGQRFLINSAMPGTADGPMVVLNWTSELVQ